MAARFSRDAVLILCGFTATLAAQQPAPAFEVASVKLWRPPATAATSVVMPAPAPDRFNRRATVSFTTVQPPRIPGLDLSRETAHPDLPSFEAALGEQLGLRLERTRGPVPVVVIDAVERPAPD